jgi:hypothetical protein
MAHLSEIDEIFNEFARAFVGTITSDRDVAFSERLAREELDGSLDSLKLVDEYLQLVHEGRAKLQPLEWETTVLWCGAYVGEVIRHLRPDAFTWIDYKDYIAAHPEVLQLIPERTVATCAFLLGPDGSMSMPLNKVARFIEEGPENAVHFFAEADLHKARREQQPRRWWSKWTPGRWKR